MELGVAVLRLLLSHTRVSLTLGYPFWDGLKRKAGYPANLQGPLDANPCPFAFCVPSWSAKLGTMLERIPGMRAMPRRS